MRRDEHSTPFTFKKIARMVQPERTVHRYDQPNQHGNTVEDLTPTQAGQVVDAAVKMKAHDRGILESELRERYAELKHEVLEASPALKRAYASVRTQRGPSDLSPRGSATLQRPCGTVLDERAREIMQKDASVLYEAAIRQALDDDPELAAAYAEGPGVGYPRLRKGR